MPRKMGVLLLIMIFLTAGILGGCGTSQKAESDLTIVRLCEVVHSIFYAPQYVAISQGLFEEQGLKIELTTAQGSDKVMTALLSDNADIGLAGSEASIYVYQQGQEDYVVDFCQLTQRDGSFLVGREAESDFKWENLKGKTIIGGRPGGMPEMVLEYVLKQHGLTPGEDVNIITNLQFTATAGAFSGGTGDYVALFEPTATLLENQGIGRVVASLGTASGEVPYTVYMARKSYLENNPEVVQKFSNAIYKAQLWVATHTSKETAQAIAPFFPDTELKDLAKVVERYKTQNTWRVNTIMDEASFNNMQDIIQSAGELEERVEPSSLINTDFAIKAIRSVQP